MSKSFPLGIMKKKRVKNNLSNQKFFGIEKTRTGILRKSSKRERNRKSIIRGYFVPQTIVFKEEAIKTHGK
tara:strand:+ start:353 stop:565 length:213 start_codon:yes stop_codon:yes gene_type:complete